MAYTTGFKEAREASKSKGKSTKLVHPIQGAWEFPKIEVGKPKFVRFLTNALPVIGFHGFVTCLDDKPRTFTCTKYLDGDLKRPCFICDNHKDKEGKPVYPRKLTLSMAVVKEKVGKEYQEETAEFELLVDPDEPEGDTETVEATRFYVVNKGQKNFWNNMDPWFDEHDETITDRDYKVIRSGKDLETTFAFMPVSGTEDGMTAIDLAEKYQIPAVEGFEDDPALGHLVNWFERKGTVEYYNTHLIGEGIETGSTDDEDDDDDAAETPARATVGSGSSGLKSRLAQKYGSSVK